MKFPKLVPALFLERPNRFVALVRLEGGETVRAHVPTTGRLTNVLEPGCQVWLACTNAPHRKTSHTLTLAELREGGYCAVQAVRANQLFAEAVAAGRLDAFHHTQIEPEITIGESRLDFRLSSDDTVCWVEVKSVTYAADGVGKFPDAPTGRGRKHLEELARLAAAGDHASAVFIAQRQDVQVFTPFEDIDPGFAADLRAVYRQGVEVHAYRCQVSLEHIEIDQEIPVRI